MWILKNSKDLLGYIQSRSLSSCISIKTFYFSTRYINISHSKLKDKLKELVQLCFINMHSQRIYRPCSKKAQILFCTKPPWSQILPKRSLKLISSNCSRFWLMPYLLCLVDVFFDRQSAYLWLQIVLFFSPTCSFIRTKQILYKGFSRKTKTS